MPSSSNSAGNGNIPRKVAQQIADLANIPSKERNSFFQGLEEVVSEASKRFAGIQSSLALKGCEQHSRRLSEALRHVPASEHSRIERLLDEHPDYNGTSFEQLIERIDWQKRLFE